MSAFGALGNGWEVRVGTRGYSSSGVRRHRVTASFDDEEWVAVGRVAAERGLRPGAWVARAAVVASEVEAGVRPVGWRELAGVREDVQQVRWLLGNIAGNLNDVARAANATGEVGEEVTAVMRLVRSLAERADADLVVLRRLLR